MTWYSFEGLFKADDYKTRSHNKILQHVDDLIADDLANIKEETYQTFEMLLHAFHADFAQFDKITMLYTPSSLYIIRDTEAPNEVGSFVFNIKGSEVKADFVMPHSNAASGTETFKYDIREFPFARVKHRLGLLDLDGK